MDDDDKKGPVAIAAAVSAPANVTPPAAEATGGKKEGDKPKPAETRIVAFGDSDFVSNAAIRVPGNLPLFMNTMNWLAQQENLIAIGPRDPQDRRITLTAGQQQLILYLTVFIVPGLVLLPRRSVQTQA